MKASEIESFARAIAAQARAWQARVRRVLCRAAPKRLRRRDRRGSVRAPRHVARGRRRRAAARRACARARDQSGARQRRRDGPLSADAGDRPDRSARGAARARHRHGRGPRADAGDRRRVESGADGAGRSEFRRRDEQGRAAHALGPLPRRDRDALSLARAGGALSRGVERCAHLRRHRVDRAAADSADVRRQVGARSDRDAARAPGTQRLRPRARVLDSNAPASAQRAGRECRRRALRCANVAVAAPRRRAPAEATAAGTATAQRDAQRAAVEQDLAEVAARRLHPGHGVSGHRAQHGAQVRAQEQLAPAGCRRAERAAAGARCARRSDRGTGRTVTRAPHLPHPVHPAHPSCTSSRLPSK